MNMNDLLFQAATQTIDALSFTQSHVIDEDFRAHSKATINSVRSLQREQRSRIEQNYGPRAVSSDAIAAQLRATYRGETTSLELMKEANERGVPPAFMANMSHSKCQVFKKEMKRRIHEWERAFREEHGVAVTAHDKASLHHVYELYKAAKNRLKETESPRKTVFEPKVEDTSELHQPQYYEKKHEPYQPQQAVYEGGGNNGDAGRDERGGTVGVQPSQIRSSQMDSAGSKQFTAPASVTSSINVPRQNSPARPIRKGKPASQMSDDDLATEKRYLKYILHRFESDFEQKNGRPPTKNDRRVWTAEYTRYGELKNEILRRSANGNQGEASNVEGGAHTRVSAGPVTIPENF
ncbi:hypothetical protein C3747_62g145 [Trypanosoma cruzi]|uniref:FAM13A-like domain-containing protein n=2 Tax=Trypanosoma cruzi TaxID=5693 RepID=Q4DID4_TRYCC|nr:hypothetical protein, conserved [Trypanosoma cruzi]EAN92285.1 hypothetical protein, conserved [Trypanosoma cruzi]PWV11189.1 hypothetical protein C3747_62g145 [Trypanosoma cruzi]|eukprot:XP_814136.1 hypothetical protein [Trypanosoma cruzi strain CL Brener]